MDVYEPSGDIEEERALIIFAHGGSFVTGDKADPAMVLIGSDFAKMGYVTASINYRLGLNTNPFVVFPDSADAFAAIVRGTHDLRAAIRWFRKDAIEGDNQYGIDTTQILIAGFSAGGFMVLHHAYLDTEAEWPGFEPDVLGVGGGVEGLSGNAGYSTAFVGGLSLAGALGDTTWIQAGDEPMMSTHGTEDDVVPYGTDTISFNLGFVVIDIAVVHGSSSVHDRLDNVGVPNCFTTYQGQGHVPESGLDAYYDTTFVKARNFFASLLCEEEVNCEYEELVSGIADINSTTILSVYPNPFTTTLAIRDVESHQIEQIELYNLNGQRLQLINSNAIDQLELSDLTKGMYILRIFDAEHGWINLKVAKQ
jgi:predicted esterase